MGHLKLEIGKKGLIVLIGLLKSKGAPFSVLEESFVMGVSNSQHHITIMNVEGWNEDSIQKVNVLATDGLPRLKRRIKTFCKDRGILEEGSCFEQAP